jgi:hypothetical protein
VKQWPSKHISVVTNKHAIVEGPWKPVFLCGLCQGRIERTNWQLIIGWSVSPLIYVFMLVSSCT